MKRLSVFVIMTMLVALPFASANVWQPIVDLGGVQAGFAGFGKRTVADFQPIYDKFEGPVKNDAEHVRYLIRTNDLPRAQAALDARDRTYTVEESGRHTLISVRR